MILITAGPRMTMNIAGIMQSNVGKMIFTGILAAFSSVSWRRLVRISDAWMRRASAMGMPCFCACSSASTN